MPLSIQTLNKDYMSFFLEHDGQVLGHFGELRKFLVDHHCTFRGEPMPTLMKPNFISPKQSHLLKRSVEVMSGALSRFIGLYLKEKQVSEIMGFSEEEEELFGIDPGYRNPLVISRLDAFLSEYSIKFLEFNCDSPAGIAYADVLEEGFKEILGLYSFLEKYQIRYTLRQDMLLASLLDCYRQFRDTHRFLPEKPVVAIVDWADVSTRSEFELHRKHFRENGIETVIATPQEFSIQGGRAIACGEEVHLIYRRVITRELLTRRKEVEPFVEAIRNEMVCCCNSFRSFIVGNKKVLSVITDQRFNSIFNSREKELIRKTVPWTRILADTSEMYHGREVSLRTFIPENKDQLVLKPSNKYGGKDVYIGKQTLQSTWEEMMNRHLDDQTWVVQEYVDIPVDQYPEMRESVRFRPKYVNINPYSLNGTYSGTITRVSDSQVINVSAGGGLVPTLTAK